MATFFQNGDPGCTAANWPQSQQPASFKPAKLNVSQWIVSMKALGVKEAVLTAKHGCGFLLWPTATKLPDGSPYTYHVPPELNVLKQFSEATEAAGIGHGFYYSLTNNMKLNVHSHYVKNGTLLPGQVKVTQAQFEAIALAQVTELWTLFGSLTEIWFDGGYTSDMKKSLTALLKTKQPTAIGYNGGGISGNPARWSKTEGDVPPGVKPYSGGDVWSTACGDTDWGPGAPPENCTDPANPPLFYPSGTDYTLQSGDTWFWEPPKGDAEHNRATPLRTLDELIYTYHQTVGSNTNMELDFAIDRDGLVEASHAALYKRFGDWIRGCYGEENILGRGTTGAKGQSAAIVALKPGQVFDRVVLQEDQTAGQKVRGWSVEWTSDGKTWLHFGSGQSIGNKRIVLAKGAMSHPASAVRFTITKSYGDVPSANISIPAPCLTGTLDTITKLGTEDIGMTETTPIVWKGELYRFESVRSGNWNNTLNCTNTNPGQGRSCKSYLRFRKQSGPPAWQAEEVATAPFGVGYALACAFVDNTAAKSTGDVFAYASDEKTAVTMWSSSSITKESTWAMKVALELPGYTVFNTAVASGMLGGKETYAMAIEVRGPKSGGLSGGFNIVFATAPTASGPWKLQQTLPAKKGLMFGPGSCPALRYDVASGYWQMLWTPNPTVSGGDYRTWQIYAARSKTLAFGEWERSPLNPVMEADAFDRQIHNKNIRADEQGWAGNTSNLNDSDADLVEFEGHVIFVGNWGDQRTTPTNNLFQAVYKGTMAEFWASLYPPSGWPTAGSSE